MYAPKSPDELFLRNAAIIIVLLSNLKTNNCVFCVYILILLYHEANLKSRHPKALG